MGGERHFGDHPHLRRDADRRWRRHRHEPRGVRAEVGALETRPITVIRSTTPVGTCQWLFRDGHVADESRFFAVPEFLAQGTALRDFNAPHRVVIGSTRSADPAVQDAIPRLSAWRDGSSNRGARVNAYDPVAAARAAQAVRGLTVHDTALATLDWAFARGVMAAPLVVDGRRLLDTAAMRDLGFVYERVGSPQVGPVPVAQGAVLEAQV